MAGPSSWPKPELAAHGSPERSGEPAEIAYNLGYTSHT